MNTSANAKKIIRVKSKTRFTIFVILLLFSAAFIINTIIGSNAVTAFDDKSGEMKNTVSAKASVSITVSQGDNLWNIAKKYKSEDMDVREAVYYIKDANNMEQSLLVSGQKLVIPVDKLQ